MKDKKTKTPESISGRLEFKRKFTIKELYRTLIFAPRAMLKLIENNKNPLVEKDFIERLHLAVTEVNGCAVCSYQHTKMALRQGMSREEISSFLSGDGNFIKPEEAKAIMFAQHFADSKGFPKQYAFDSIVKEYGKEKAVIILAACQVIIIGNMYGIPYSALLSRLKGKPYKGSTLVYELGMLIAEAICLPIATLHGLLRALIHLPNEKFDNIAE